MTLRQHIFLLGVFDGNILWAFLMVTFSATQRSTTPTTEMELEEQRIVKAMKKRCQCSCTHSCHAQRLFATRMTPPVCCCVWIASIIQSPSRYLFLSFCLRAGAQMRTPCPRGCMSHPPPSHTLGGANRKLRMKRLKGKKRLKRQHQKAEEAKCVRLPFSWMTVGSDQAHDWAALAFRSGLSRQAIARGTSTATRSAQGPLPAGVPPVAETAAEGDRREEGEAQRAPEVCCAGLESPSLETLPQYTPPSCLSCPVCCPQPGEGGAAWPGQGTASDQGVGHVAKSTWTFSPGNSSPKPKKGPLFLGFLG